MKIYVDLDHVDITEYTQIESGEYNTQKINFIFTPEYKDLVKVAIFGSKLDTEEPKFYKIYLSDDSCYLPSEVTATSDVISIGVYAFNVENGELKLRYSPTPVKTIVYEGSFREEAENASSPTPTEIEQIMSRIISLEEITQELDTRVEALENKSCDLDTIKSDVEQLKTDVVDLDDRLDDVEGDLADTYSKEEVNTLLGSKVDTTTYNSGQAAQDEKIELAELILSQLPEVSDSGETISLSPTIEAPMKINPKGQCKQVTLTGKNKFEPTLSINGTPIIQQRCTVTLDDDEFTFVATGNDIYFGNVVATGNSYSETCGNLIEIPTGTTKITIISTNTGFDGMYYNFYDSDKKSLGYGKAYATGTTVVENAKYLGVRVGVATATSGNTYKTKVMVTFGNVDNTYEKYCGGIPSPNPNYPQDIQVVTGTQTVTISNADNTESQTYTLHLEDLELCKIGTYQDKIYYDNGKWYKYGAIGKVVLNGSEDYTKIRDYVFSTSLSSALFPSNTSELMLEYCNYYTGVSNSATWNNYDYLLSYTTGKLVFRNKDTQEIADFKTWLGAHNTIVYYVLANATDTEITNETLLQDLNNIKENAMSYSGTTNINTTGNLPIIITASALKQLS